MTTYYFDGSPIVAPLTFESNEPIFAADTISLKQQRASQGAQRWELSFMLQNKDFEQDYFVAMVSKANNAKTMIMPQLLAVDKRVTTSEAGTVAEDYEQSDNELTVYFSTSGELVPKSSFIKFSNHSKVYLLLEDVVTSSSSIVKIFPNLRQPVPLATIMYHPGSIVKPEFSFYQSVDTIKGVIYEDGVMVNPGTIKILEAL